MTTYSIYVQRISKHVEVRELSSSQYAFALRGYLHRKRFRAWRLKHPLLARIATTARGFTDDSDPARPVVTILAGNQHDDDLYAHEVIGHAARNLKHTWLPTVMFPWAFGRLFDPNGLREEWRRAKLDARSSWPHGYSA